MNSRSDLAFELLNELNQLHSLKQQPSTSALFNRQAMENLLPLDQDLFEHFSQGPIIEPHFVHIHQAFEHQALTNPDSIAACHNDESITYAELNAQAEALAELLMHYGVSQEDNLGLFTPPSIASLVGMLAILKSGATYVPQDIDQTSIAALKHITESTSIKIILTLSHCTEKMPKTHEHMRIYIDHFIQQNKKSHHKLSTINKKRATKNHSPYSTILFEPGTASEINGTQITHKNLCQTFLTYPGHLNISRGNKVSQMHSISNSLSLWEIWSCLSHGGTLIINDQQPFDTLIQCHTIIVTTDILELLNPDQCSNLKVIAVIGNQCSKALVDKWVDQCTFYCYWGVLESTIIATAKRYHSDNDQVTLGSPVPNHTTYILDTNLLPCPIGEIGEVWAGGSCISKDYLSIDSERKKRFYPDPFLGDNHKMFPTQLMARWTKNGELEPMSTEESLLEDYNSPPENAAD